MEPPVEALLKSQGRRRFELWSVGPDGKDDGGVYRTRNQKNQIVGEDRDWPWPSATPNTERMF